MIRFYRSPPILPLSLTIANVPLPSASESENLPEPSIKLALGVILPSVIHIPLSISFLNESCMSPVSKEEDLHSGILQLPAGTAVVVSDAYVSEGTLTQRRMRYFWRNVRSSYQVTFAGGLENVNALKQCASSQTLAYKFPYNDYTFKTSLNFVMLAQGKGSPFLEVRYRRDYTCPGS